MLHRAGAPAGAVSPPPGAALPPPTFSRYCVENIKDHRCIFALYLAAVIVLIALMATGDWGTQTNAITSSVIVAIPLIAVMIACCRFRRMSSPEAAPLRGAAPAAEASVSTLNLDDCDSLEQLITRIITANGAKMHAGLIVDHQHTNYVRFLETVHEENRTAIFRVQNIDGHDAYLIPVKRIVGPASPGQLYILVSATDDPNRHTMYQISHLAAQTRMFDVQSNVGDRGFKRLRAIIEKTDATFQLDLA